MQFRPRMEEEREPSPDNRPKATGWIWFWATLMMGPAVPISFFSQSTVVPLCIIGGAALSSVCVWAFGGSPSRRDPADRRALQQATVEAARLRTQVEEMEQRLHALETIRSYEQACAEREEQARFGAPHQPAFDTSADSLPTASSPARSNPGQQKRDGRVAEG